MLRNRRVFHRQKKTVKLLRGWREERRSRRFKDDTDGENIADSDAEDFASGRSIGPSHLCGEQSPMACLVERQREEESRTADAPEVSMRRRNCRQHSLVSGIVMQRRSDDPILQ